MFEMLNYSLNRFYSYAALLGFCHLLNADEIADGHFSSWENVPELIENSSLDALRKITRIELSKPLGVAESEEFISSQKHIKKRWQKWWKTTGADVMRMKKKDAKIDEVAFKLAQKFLGKEMRIPKDILPVWIPNSWTLCVTFTNGDYGLREKENWMIDRDPKSVHFTKLRGDYSKGEWSVALTQLDDFTVDQADTALKALCYVHRYAAVGDELKSINDLNLYYPSATLRLQDGKGGVIWNIGGYGFSKLRQRNERGESGRSYLFLRSQYGDKKLWSSLTNVSESQFAPYRNYLSYGKPYSLS